MPPVTALGKNRVLALLPPHVRDDMTPLLQAQTFAPNDVLLEERAPIDRVYFPADGIISVVGPMQEGAEAESYTIGSDGFFGLSLVLGADRLAQRTTCQVPGTFYVTSAAQFEELAQKHAELRRAALLYAHCLMSLTAQSAACNLTHDVAARCARWLLLVQDRVHSDRFTLTQEILATMLGVQRPAVSIAAGALQRAGFIRYSRGNMTVVDRDGLANASCECYRVVADEFDRYLPSTA